MAPRHEHAEDGEDATLRRVRSALPRGTEPSSRITAFQTLCVSEAKTSLWDAELSDPLNISDFESTL